LRASLDLARKLLGERHLYTTVILYQIALTQAQQNQNEESETTFQECLDVVRAHGMLPHPQTATVMEPLVAVLCRQQKYSQAEAILQEWIAGHRDRPGPFLADALTVYGNFLFSTGKYDRETPVLQEAMALYRKEARPPRRQSALNCRRDLAWAWSRGGRHAEAERLAAENLPLVRERCGGSGEAAAVALNQVAALQLRQRKVDADVESSLVEARSILTPKLPFVSPPPLLTDVHLNLSTLYRLRGQAIKAAASARSARGLTKDHDKLLAAAREFAWCSSDLSRAWATAGQSEEIRRLADEAVRTLRLATEKGILDPRSLEKENAFQPLRQREDFQQLLRALRERQAKPPA